MAAYRVPWLATVLVAAVAVLPIARLKGTADLHRSRAVTQNNNKSVAIRKVFEGMGMPVLIGTVNASARIRTDEVLQRKAVGYLLVAIPGGPSELYVAQHDVQRALELILMDSTLGEAWAPPKWTALAPKLTVNQRGQVQNILTLVPFLLQNHPLTRAGL